ncbi:hotdog fold thioesterase, partial [Enterobacter hormaechei]|uniref:hotdog fold thioesterase n=1 Tax=Enterobacter hormaechei TaxID=158836 RepID=UPI003D6DAC03
MIWKRAVTLEALNAMGAENMVGLLDIQFTRIGDDELEATMPVDRRTHQPFGLLHGGASVVLAETLGSVAGYLCTEGEQKVVGLEVNANHIRSVRSGHVGGHWRAQAGGGRAEGGGVEVGGGHGSRGCGCRGAAGGGVIFRVR